MEAIIDDLKLPVSKTWQSGVLAEFEFEKYQAQVADWKKKADELVITDASQLTEMKLADEGRKILQKIRTTIEKKRKELKEQSLQEGRAIDAIAKALTALVEPIERTLEEKAKYAENLEKARIEKLHEERLALILPFLDAVPVAVNYGSLDNGTWTAILKHAEQEYKDRVEAENAARIAAEEAEKKKQVHTERRIALAPYQEYGFFDLHEDTTEEEFQAMLTEGKESKRREDADREERARVAAELAAEKDRELKRIQLQHQREKSLLAVDFNPEGIDLSSMTQDEFSELYKKHQTIYLEKVRQERELQEKEAEAQRQKAEAEKAAASAPDIEKLQKLSVDLGGFALPECSTPEGQRVTANVRLLIGKIRAYIGEQVDIIQNGVCVKG